MRHVLNPFLLLLDENVLLLYIMRSNEYKTQKTDLITKMEEISSILKIYVNGKGLFFLCINVKIK